MSMRRVRQITHRDNIITFVAGEPSGIVDGVGDAPDVIVEGEYVGVVVVDLPLAQHKLRVAAAPYAIEDRVSQPLSELYVVLGPEIAPQRFLVSYVDRARMDGWLTKLAELGIVPGRVLPDAMLLPEPDSTTAWTTKVDGERVLVRTGGHEAFATSATLFETLWSAAGRPDLYHIGDDSLPAHIPVTPGVNAPARHVIDLIKGVRTGATGKYAAPLKIAASLIGVAALAHMAILAIDTAVVSSAAEQRKDEAARLISSVAPAADIGADPASVLEQMLPGGEGADRRGAFLPLLSRVSTSLQPVAPGLAVQALAYDEADGALELKVETADLPALEGITSALTDAGFKAQSGGASVADGRAESTLTIRDSLGPAAGDGAP